MAVSSSIWRRRLVRIAQAILAFFWVAVIYLASELIIWGLSRALAPVNLSFFSSIFGMALTFTAMAIASIWVQNIGDIYKGHIKEKIDFINAHLGLGFPIPLVMLNQSDILNAHDIARIIGNFVITNLASWMVVFGMSLLIMSSTNAASRTSQEFCDPQPMMTTAPQLEITWPSNSTLEQSINVMNSGREKTRRGSTPYQEVESSATTTRRSSIDQCMNDNADASLVWNFFTSYFPLLASFFSIFLIGTPIAAATKEDRVLDGCVLWFVWAASVRLQKNFKISLFLLSTPRLKNALVTIMNPVLMTTLLMTAYTRGKASAYGSASLPEVLHIFSSGTPLYTLWTSAVTSIPLPAGTTAWFGAGDAALSILECGILIWGFKLYECQRQLFSSAGLLTVLISVAAAAGNVFLSVLSGRTFGLATPEALAFAARSTTLALAKPAMAAVGGNLGANAALVVSNGILGQLMYPVALDKLGVKAGRDSISSQDGVSPSVANTQDSHQRHISHSKEEEDFTSGDDPVTIAAGIAIGINGAAMGVSYLYETRSRAAPYAALAMTVFGIMTVVFTTVEPFKGVLTGLASR
ncbi:hypothetical protein BGZ61DRAFT_526241 [Ilyonectria robusta]|uniref:uncharacterized protein n=1 Tax=Ilyonectria robusta TaxID=1079257 RepID=UPI001E8DE4D3|nr:uncharacterized protein BGZ61DRAFT_526241 [Ilyonectria robusta]KAH8738252.1 hypothetical protein BGZ61DRAFT_526241 [Ilyonectria robusta]